MFDKKGRWWPQRLADKKVRKEWKRLQPYTCAGAAMPWCCAKTKLEMRSLGRCEHCAAYRTCGLPCCRCGMPS